MSPDLVEDICGCRVTLKTKEQCVDDIVNWIESSGRCKYLICANPHSLEVARKDALFAKAIQNADIIVPDGIGIVFASRILGGVIRERVTGMDIFLGLNSVLNKKLKCSSFFLGSSAENLEKIVGQLHSDFPRITVAGIYAPPFKEQFTQEEEELMVDAINRTAPDVLWVGMTAPKQEKWIYQNKNRLHVNFIGAVGAVFDFYSGKKKRAHPWFQQHGLEWLSRFISEPRRLWRRNIISNPIYLSRVISKRLFK